jgi:hypothetical protein
MIEVGKKALNWLMQVQTGEGGVLSIIGTNGWFMRGGERAQYDQQPIEAHALIDACIEAYHVTREEHWTHQARQALDWFLEDAGTACTPTASTRTRAPRVHWLG